MTSADVRLGADIGGTFTDVVLAVGDTLYSTKKLTTYAAPEAAIVAGLLDVCAQADVLPAQISEIIHGTTLATNALIERSGAKTALITTDGFRDVIEMRTESRFEQYDLNLKLPDPLLARQHRYTVRERVAADGEVLLPLSADQLDALVESIAAGGYASVAVGFIHAYANPSHEQAVRDALVTRLPDLMVSLSSDVSSQMREYERFNTVVANAYVKPLMKSYLQRLAERLADAGATAPVYLMHSGGGIISLASAAEFPVRLVESGPAGGAVFAADIAARYDIDKALSFDMGGTTAKICLIDGKTPTTSRVFEVARTYRFKKGSGMPISIPVIDMVEIGAGGGSLATVDALQQIRVGPQSAGSEPGPACYGRGGEGPAVTDADLTLGRLDPDDFAGGSIALDSQAAAAALERAVAAPLDMDIETAAFGVAEVVDENMANAARMHAVENGEDLSDYTMIAFGGAAPLHAARLCEKLGVRRLLVPQGAGVGSAIGFLRAPFSFEATRSVFMPLADFDARAVAALLAELEREAIGFVRTCKTKAAIRASHKVYMRYAGQGWEIPVPLPQTFVDSPTAAHCQELFESVYRGLFSRTVTGAAIEMTVWAVNAATAVRPVEPVVAAPPGAVATAMGTRRLFDAASGAWVSAAVIRRDSLKTSDVVRGPAVITETETSIVVSSRHAAIAQADGCIDIHERREMDGQNP